MSKFLSLRKLVKETRTSTCTRIIVVENSSDRIAVKVTEYLTDWARTFPNPSEKVLSRPGQSLKDVEAYASHLLDASSRDGFVRALWHSNKGALHRMLSRQVR
jgi:hypothetical protein